MNKAGQPKISCSDGSQEDLENRFMARKYNKTQSSVVTEQST